MAKAETINVQIDQKALRKQIQDTLDEEMVKVAIRLHNAAFEIGGDKFLDIDRENFKHEYERGYADARKKFEQSDKGANT